MGLEVKYWLDLLLEMGGKGKGQRRWLCGIAVGGRVGSKILTRSTIDNGTWGNGDCNGDKITVEIYTLRLLRDGIFFRCRYEIQSAAVGLLQLVVAVLILS